MFGMTAIGSYRYWWISVSLVNRSVCSMSFSSSDHGVHEGDALHGCICRKLDGVVKEIDLL